MDRFRINDQDFVDLPEIIKRIRYSLRNKVGFSLVRIGDAENQVMSQGMIIPEEKIKKIWWADNEDWTGIKLPNYEARDRLIESVKQADMVGVLHQSDAFVWKPLTEQIFTLCGIKPKQICYAFINIYFAQSLEFIALMRNCRLLLIGKPAAQFARFLKTQLDINIAAFIPINNYDEIFAVLEQIKKIEFDMALISAGSNAIILASVLGKIGKVALDFGRGMNPEYWKGNTLHAHKIFNTYNIY